MIPRILSRIAARLRRSRRQRDLSDARKAYHALCNAFDDAVERRDTRDQGRLTPGLQAAARAVLAAENALWKPAPLPRRAYVAAKAGRAA